MKRSYEWSFPLPRTHTGMLQGNALLGVMIWGEGSVLRLTVGRADLWDHRGGMPWTESMSYDAIRRCLEANDEDGLRKLFERTPSGDSEPARPSILPVGRMEIDFGPGAELERGVLHLRDGLAEVDVLADGKRHTVEIVTAMDAPAASVRLPAHLSPAEIRRVPAWEHVGEHLASIGFAPPEMFGGEDLVGWTQALPADPAVCIGFRKQGRNLVLAVERGESPERARAATAELATTALSAGFDHTLEAARKWWSGYWKGVPTLKIPNKRLRFLYEYGMYKFAGLTRPGGVAAGLQGPWIEEYQMPPWSADYHFNINVQMCYWPAYRGNRPEHLRPLFDLIKTWEPTLRHNAKVFCGIDDGLMLPHAVDDRCVCMGGFWTGSVDHGCTAWVAEMMFRYYRYTLDETFLREEAYPFMVGAMRVYEEMLEREGDGFVLPVSVSPEYRGAAMNAWGRNASFQLACCHRLAEDLLAAAEILGESTAPVWREIQQKLPTACLLDAHNGQRIGLWEGTDLEESHRHHSHLAGIAPFGIIDIDDPAWRPVVLNSIAHWIKQGPGLWSGWCVPWASMLHTRLGNADYAEVLLEVWERVFTNEGHGTLHDCHIAGFTLMGGGATCSGSTRGEIMQMDAGMSCVAAIQEMLLHERRGVHYLFAGAPSHWKTASFDGMLAAGAVRVSASRKDGVVEKVTLESEAGGEFRLANPWGVPAALKSKGRKKERLEGDVLNVTLEPGQTVTLRKA